TTPADTPLGRTHERRGGMNLFQEVFQGVHGLSAPPATDHLAVVDAWLGALRAAGGVSATP
ncbi:hypothetical protein, partial [Nocardiopsis halophila]|uniref:hypothetical protein n=1 Tax=Nocardiopsis halophila TaxID=141692 RepID=UPI0019D3F49B